MAVVFLGHYQLVEEEKTWHEAEKYCREMNMYLATMRAPSANNILQELLRSRYAYLYLPNEMNLNELATGMYPVF